MKNKSSISELELNLEAPDLGVFELRQDIPNDVPPEARIHIYGNNKLCETDTRGYSTPGNINDPAELMLHRSEGFIPLWEKNQFLRWRFSPLFIHYFSNPEPVKKWIRKILGAGLVLWEDAVPIKFTEKQDAWDFEIVINEDKCNLHNNCSLAKAFFPDNGRHELVLYPKLFEQPVKEQIETMAHELGHIFGLRHFFAELTEKNFPSVRFNHDKQNPFSIMNYGEHSEMTEDDISDLKLLYEKVWSGELTEINGTPIALFSPFHVAGGRYQHILNNIPKFQNG